MLGLVIFSGALFTSGYFMAKSQAPAKTLGVDTAAPVQQAPPTVSIETIKGLWDKDVIKFGNGDKKLLAVEISDPSCPYCHAAGGSNKTIGAQMGQQFILKSEGGTYVAPVAEMKRLVNEGKADFVYIYSPGHGNGELATKAMYCANDMGKFWQAHDVLMSDKAYDFINETVKNDMAKSGEMADFLASVVDKNKLKECLDSGKYDARIKSDTALAIELGVQGTPGFFLNETNFAGAYSWTDMESVANAALN